MKLIPVLIKISLIGMLLTFLMYGWSHFWVTEEIRPVLDYNRIDISGIVNVSLTEGPEPEISVRADQQFIGQIKTEVRNGVLNIWTEGRIQRERIMNVAVVYTSLDGIKIGGAATLKSHQFVRADKLNVQVDEAAEVLLQVACDSLNLEMRGAGNVQLAGTTDYFDFQIYGFGDLVAYNLDAGSVRVKMDNPPQSKGIARISAAKELEAEIRGPRYLYVKGNAAIISQKVVGKGKIVRK